MYQLKAVIGMVVRPKATLVNLPSDRFLILGLIVAGYFGFARVIRGGQLRELADATGTPLIPLAMFTVFAVVGYVVGALVIKLIVRLFGKRLTLRKVMNILGYAQVPRFLFAVPLSMALALAPADFKQRLLLGDYNGLTITASTGGGGLTSRCS